MTGPKISIIIPVYNVEIYLRECLDSCVNQTLEDIEIICVDDCSTDNSYEILEEYQQKDSRIKIFKQERNNKQGAARNKGLEVATGEYIWFVDSDDYIDTKACQILYNAIKEFGVDMLCFSATQFSEENGYRKYFYDGYFHQGIQINKIYHPQTDWRKIKFAHMNVTPWAYITKASMIQKFRFREGVWHEDIDFTPILLASANSFCFIPYSAYFRRNNPSSTTQTAISQKRSEDLVKTLEYLDKFVSDKKISKNHFLYNQLVAEIYGISKTLLSLNDIQPNNVSVLPHLLKKYHRSLDTYIKTLRPPKYSLKRFVGKVLKRIRGK
ncbi:glycosyltransferase family 2 protein [bacterium]|nr:glycosyltransferase family 2 protein [bacterium]